MHRATLRLIPIFGLAISVLIVLLSSGCGSESSEPESDAALDAPTDSAYAFTPEADPAPPPEELAVPNGRQLFEDVITGGQPTEAQLRAAHEQGIRTVVNLRPNGEFDGFDERAIVDELGMQYIHIPISGPDDVTEETAAALNDVLADTTNRPLLMHCSSGNRVGSLFAARAYFLHDTDPERALDIGTHAGLTRLEAPLRTRWTRE
jgi:uncharacterized protein (TIGR01244 family)